MNLKPNFCNCKIGLHASRVAMNLGAWSHKANFVSNHPLSVCHQKIENKKKTRKNSATLDRMRAFERAQLFVARHTA